MTRVEDFGEGLRITLDRTWWPLMEMGDYLPGYCVVCGRTNPINKHHMVPKSAGEVIDIRRRKMRKPLVHLCGFGNNLQDADGRFYCHGKVHQNLLHFRNNNGVLEVLDLTDPATLQRLGLRVVTSFPRYEALELNGWRPVW